MPELPEVETIKLGLLRAIKHKKIMRVKALWAKSLEARPKQVKDFILNQKIVDIRRRGKVLIIDLANNYSLLIHLKMTGQLVVEPKQGQRFAGGHPTKSMAGKLPDASTRLVFELNDGSRLFFNDQRKFGWIQLVDTPQIIKHQLINTMGPEPLEAGFSIKDFDSKVNKRKAPVKAILLDQKTVAGLGNIYVDEALHLAKIHPLRAGSSLSMAEIKRLHQAIIAVLKQSLGYGGTSFTNYVNALGVEGNYLDYARVFRRQGQPCPVCQTPIQKTKVAGRGTHFCPVCQRL